MIALTRNEEDFYFLVINKTSKAAIENEPLLKSYLFSLKTLKEVKPNGNNLPFQCVWKNNTVPVSRTYEEAKSFLLKSYGDSLRKRNERYEEFKKCFPEHACKIT
ncbi:MAG: hypothetical protein HAW61_03580 [Candidatus Portiera sp.]|nr:hypothetical protein [Portiera sp.]